MILILDTLSRQPQATPEQERVSRARFVASCALAERAFRQVNHRGDGVRLFGMTYLPAMVRQRAVAAPMWKSQRGRPTWVAQCVPSQMCPPLRILTRAS